MKLYLVNLIILGKDRLKRVLDKYPDIGYLLSYLSIKDFNKIVNSGIKNIMIDSGAYSAFTQGKYIDIDKLCESYLNLSYPSDVNVTFVSLDVIGDKEGGRESLRNWDYMTNKGIKCIPTFHMGDDWEVLDYYASKTDYIGLGGLVTKVYTSKTLNNFITQVYNRYPNHKFHLFGINNFNVTNRYKVYSCDSLSWRCGGRFGRIILPSGSGCNINKTSEMELKKLGVIDLLANYSIKYPLSDDFHFSEIDLINIDILYNAIVSQKETKIPDSVPMYLF